MKTGHECTAYFKGIDGLGSCDSECQWWHKGACPCAKGSKSWDGKDHNTMEHYTRKDKEEAKMSKYVYAKHEAINDLDDFKKYLKENDDIKLKRTELACLKRYLHWLYDEEELVIVGF